MQVADAAQDALAAVAGVVNNTDVTPFVPKLISALKNPGEVNTLIVILVDDSANHRYLTNLAFYKDGDMVE